MWICRNNSFVSIVADRNNANRLLVRARRRSDLEGFLGDTKADIFSDLGSDYRWRAFLDRATVTLIVADAVQNEITYDNFKSSVKDNDRHDLYMAFWRAGMRYQQDDPQVRQAPAKAVSHPRRKGGTLNTGRA